jgi:hypothetical protein
VYHTRHCTSFVIIHFQLCTPVCCYTFSVLHKYALSLRVVCTILYTIVQCTFLCHVLLSLLLRVLCTVHASALLRVCVPYTTLLNIYYYTYLVVFNISYITAPHVHLMHIYESCVSAHLYISYVTAHHVYHCSYIVCQSTSCIPLLILIIGPCFTVIVYCTFYVPCFTAHFLLPILYTIVNYIAFVVLSYWYIHTRTQLSYTDCLTLGRAMKPIYCRL